MNNKEDHVYAGEWVVHIDAKIWGTIVWEGIINGFENKQAAERWQRVFMEHAPHECSTALVLTRTASYAPVLAGELKEEIERFIHQTQEE